MTAGAAYPTAPVPTIHMTCAVRIFGRGATGAIRTTYMSGEEGGAGACARPIRREVSVGLIKTAEQILQGRPRPVDYVIGKHNKGGRPRLDRPCKLLFKGCERPHWGHGYCRVHGRKFVLYGHPEATARTPLRCLCLQCPVHQPSEVPFQRKDRPRLGKSKPTYTHCQVPGCTRVHHSKGMCKTCGRKKERWGSPLHVYVPGSPPGRCGCPEHKEK